MIADAITPAKTPSTGQRFSRKQGGRAKDEIPVIGILPWSPPLISKDWYETPDYQQDIPGKPDVTPDYSIIIPVYNEAESLDQLVTEICDVMNSIGKAWEVIFVNDGSTDGSEAELSRICNDQESISAIHLTQNSGKSAAYRAGFSEVKGSVILTLDGDLQDDPAEIPKLIKKLERGDDMVIGWKKGRIRNEWYKSVPSRFYNNMKALLFGIRLTDSNSGFRIFRREVISALDLYGDRYRFIPELSHLAGFKVGETAVRHRKRIHGSSKYGASRFYTGFMDLISVRFVTLFSGKPLQFFGLIAVPLISIGSLLEFYVLIQKLTGSDFRTHVAAIIVGVLLILVGVQFLAIGLVGEMLIAINGNRELPSIKKKEGRPGPDSDA